MTLEVVEIEKMRASKSSKAATARRQFSTLPHKGKLFNSRKLVNYISSINSVGAPTYLYRIAEKALSLKAPFQG